MGERIQAGSGGVPVRVDRRGHPILETTVEAGRALAAVKCPACGRTLLEMAVPVDTPAGLLVRKQCGPCQRMVDIRATATAAAMVQ